MKSVLILGLLALFGCSTSINDYKATSSPLNLKAFFNDRVTAYGIIEDFQQKLARHFCVDIVSNWKQNTGTLHETFYFNDGEQQIRIWELTLLDDGQVIGTAADVIGQAKGQIKGGVMFWEYTLAISLEKNTYHVDIEDWLYKLSEHQLMNRSYMKKWGVTVAEISIFFDNSHDPAPCQVT